MQTSTKVHVFRLMPHEDLKKSILRFAKENAIHAGIVLTCVGSLEQINLRFANQESGSVKQGSFEIVSLTGTFSDDGTGHFHISVADHTGSTLGGHLLEENLIYTTAEIAIAELSDLHFFREIDPAYGYKELVVRRHKRSATS